MIKDLIEGNNGDQGDSDSDSDDRDNDDGNSNAKGDVLFVDEAYQLTAPHVSGSGRQALDIILTEMENKVDKLVVIFVGYNEEIQSFFEHNPGLASTVPYTLQFHDFEDAELWNILRKAIIDKYGTRMWV